MDQEMTPYRNAVRAHLHAIGASPVMWEEITPRDEGPQRASKRRGSIQVWSSFTQSKKSAVAIKDGSHIVTFVQLLLLTCESKEDSGLAQQGLKNSM
jgi:hypothetical protein